MEQSTVALYCQYDSLNRQARAILDSNPTGVQPNIYDLSRQQREIAQTIRQRENNQTAG